VRESASPGCVDAVRMAIAKRSGLLRQPDENDVPPPTPFPGPKAVVLPWQLVLGQDLEEEEEPAA
jgi:hypothetical protein